MRLSKRLETVASFVPKGHRLADIGTDHGYIPIYLVENGRIPQAIAMDVRTGPLTRARDHIRQYGLSEQIKVRLSDGLAEIAAGEADTVVIAGMGGELMIRILAAGRHMWESVSVWVLSPQSEFSRVRHYLQEQGFVIDKETMLCEDGKYYTVMAVGRGKMRYDREIDYRYGKYLLKNRHPVLRDFLEKEIHQTETLLARLEAKNTDGAKQRQDELKEELKQMKEAFDEMQ